MQGRHTLGERKQFQLSINLCMHNETYSFVSLPCSLLGLVDDTKSGWLLQYRILAAAELPENSWWLTSFMCFDTQKN